MARSGKEGYKETPFKLADRVEAYWAAGDEWCPARIVKVLGAPRKKTSFGSLEPWTPSGFYLVRFEGFPETHELPLIHIRTPESWEAWDNLEDEEEEEEGEEEDEETEDVPNEEEEEEMEVVVVDEEPQIIHESAVPDPLQEQLQRIEANDPSLTKVNIRDNRSFNKVDCGILARSLSHNTCVTILDLEGTHIGPSWAALLCPAMAHLTRMTYLNLNGTGLQSAGARHLCSAIVRLSAMTELRLSNNNLVADDGAQICHAAAAAGMRGLVVLDLTRNDLDHSSVMDSETWRQLRLQKPPQDFFDEFEIADFTSLTQFLIKQQQVGS